MTLETWLAFCLVTAVLCFTPGPAVVFVTSVALGGGTRPGMQASLGILVGNAVFFALSATGVVAAAVVSEGAFRGLRWAGAAYLGWMGVRMLLTGSGDAGAIAPRVVSRALWRGCVVQLTNPAALGFFTSLVPQFVDPEHSVGPQVALLGVSAIAIELGSLSVLVMLAARARVVAGPRFAGILERIGGGVLLATALWLLVGRAS